MSVLKIKVENVLLYHKSIEQDNSFYVLYTYPPILCSACISFSKIFKF